MTPEWAQLEFTGPQWVDYAAQLNHLNNTVLAGNDFPGAMDLQDLLPKPVLTQSGLPVRFVSSGDIPTVAYEEHIHRTGEISTRPNNWHDLFNALVWSRFPGIKAAMNAVHCEEIIKQPGPERGAHRDALTLFDECGVVVASQNKTLLSALAARNWRQAFQSLAHCWQHRTCVFICGHALLEKFLSPYKAMTAQALLFRLDDTQAELTRKELMASVDTGLAQAILAGALLQSSRELSPLPLAGIPGWWTESPQNDSFYDDPQVFRPPADDFQAAPIVQRFVTVSL